VAASGDLDVESGSGAEGCSLVLPLLERAIQQNPIQQIRFNKSDSTNPIQQNPIQQNPHFMLDRIVNDMLFARSWWPRILFEESTRSLYRERQQ
jgi:hypothetical protein